MDAGGNSSGLNSSTGGQVLDVRGLGVKTQRATRVLLLTGGEHQRNLSVNPELSHFDRVIPVGEGV